MTIAQVRDDLLSKLGIEVAADAPVLALQDCIVAINGAMQLLRTAGQDFFTRVITSVTLVPGTGDYLLAATVQSVLGPIRLDGRPLQALLSRGELDQYARIVDGTSDFGRGDGDPNAYWIQNLDNGATSGDIDKVTVMLAPVPISVGTLAVELNNVATAYAVADFTPGTLVLPVAQGYTESILLPLARMLVTRSSQFSRPELLDGLTADADTAARRLGYDGGFPNAVQAAATREVNA